MKEAGANAEDILKHLVDNRLDIDARALWNAGFSLSELVQAREKPVPFSFPPPCDDEDIVRLPIETGWLFCRRLSKCRLSRGPIDLRRRLLGQPRDDSW